MAIVPNKLVITIDPHNALPAFLNRQRTPILTIVGAVAVAIADGLVKHHVDPYVVGQAALVALAAVCRSALVPRTDAPASADSTAQ